MEMVFVSISSWVIREETARLITAVAARVPTMISSESQIGISGAH